MYFFFFVLLLVKARKKLALVQIKNAFFITRVKNLILHTLAFFTVKQLKKKSENFDHTPLLPTSLPPAYSLWKTQDTCTFCPYSLSVNPEALPNNKGTAQYLRYYFSLPHCCYQSSPRFTSLQYANSQTKFPCLVLSNIQPKGSSPIDRSCS